jgi:hypothetical protein
VFESVNPLTEHNLSVSVPPNTEKSGCEIDEDVEDGFTIQSVRETEAVEETEKTDTLRDNGRTNETSLNDTTPTEKEKNIPSFPFTEIKVVSFQAPLIS